MTKVDFALQIGGLIMITIGLGLVLVGYLKLSSSTITGLTDLLSTYFVTLLLGPFLIIWGTMILGIGWIAEASRRTPNDTVEDGDTKEEVSVEPKPSR